MAIRLSETDRQMLDGARGEAAAMAMTILSRMAEVTEAPELMDITGAHIDGCGLLSEAGLEFAETLAGAGAEVVVPTTLNMGPLDLANWRAFGVDEAFAARAIRQATAYESMGCVPTWTCAPYQGYLTPRFGQQIAWGESNAIVYANSVLGARTNRYGDYIDICAAITGRVPKCGLHLKANRAGQVLVRLAGLSAEDFAAETFWPVLGHLIGRRVDDRIAVIEGLPDVVSEDEWKAFGAAAASAGGIALFHAVGLTPEAPTREEAFQGREPAETIDLTPADLDAARAEIVTAEPDAPLDLVVVGCPHLSFAEFRRLVRIVRDQGGRRVHENVAFVAFTGRSSHALVKPTGWLDELAAFGIRVTLDTCVFHTPMVHPEAKVLMTNSGKCAYYAPGELGVAVALGSLADCVLSAVAGRVVREGD